VNRESADGLKACARCGANANARQTRETVDRDIPAPAAIDLVHQCVAFSGVSSCLSTTTRSTSASVTFPGTPSGSRIVAQATQTASQQSAAPGADRNRRNPSMTE
jgi:hypothetical protein